MKTIHDDELARETRERERREAIESALRAMDDAHLAHVLELESLLSGLAGDVHSDNRRVTRQSWTALNQAHKSLKAALAAAGFGGGL